MGADGAATRRPQVSGSTSSPSRCRRCTRRSPTRSPRGRRRTSPSSTRSGSPSSQPPDSSTRSRSSTRTGSAREHEADFLDPLVAANRYEGRTFGVSAVRGRRRALVPPTRARARWSSSRPRPGRELRAVARTLARDGMPHPVVMPGGSQGRRDDRVLPDRVPRLERRAGVAGRRRHASTRPQPSRRCGSSAASSTTALMSPDVVGYEWDRPIRLLAEGKAAISFGGSYEARDARRGARSSARRALGSRRLHLRAWRTERPPRERHGGHGVRHLPAGRPAQAGNAPAREHRGAGSARTGRRRTGRVPPRRSAIALTRLDPSFVSMVVRTLEHAVTRPATPSYPRVSAQLQAMLEAVLTGRLGPERAAQRTAEMIEAITGLPVLASADGGASSAVGGQRDQPAPTGPAGATARRGRRTAGTGRV